MVVRKEDETVEWKTDKFIEDEDYRTETKDALVF